MNIETIYVHNYSLEVDEIEDGLIFFLEDDQVVILHKHEQMLYELFDGKKTLNQISLELGNKFSNYLCDDFFNFALSLEEKNIIIKV